jgi:leucine dehydrogenase
VESLGGLYITAEDVGTDMEDMELIQTETRWVTGVSPGHGGSGDPSPVTAYGTLQGMKAAVKWQFGALRPQGPLGGDPGARQRRPSPRRAT